MDTKTRFKIQYRYRIKFKIQKQDLKSINNTERKFKIH